MKPVRFLLGLGLAVGLATSPSWGYEEIPVSDGGTLQGMVTLLGGSPQTPRGYNLVTLPDAVYCGRISTGTGWRLLQPFVIGPNGGFKNVVVYIEEIHKGKPFRYVPPRITAVDCTFEPYITIVRDRYDIEVVNMDPVFHDIQGYETSKFGARVLFNVPLPMSKKLRKEVLLAGKTVKDRAGKVLTQHIKMGKTAQPVRDAMRISRLHGELGIYGQNPLLRAECERRRVCHFRHPPGDLYGPGLASHGEQGIYRDDHAQRHHGLAD